MFETIRARVLSALGKSTLRPAARAKLPTEFGEFEIHAYEDLTNGKEHVALVCGDIGDGHGVVVRLHSSCLTGDVFHSARCDCGPQLHTAMARVAAEGATSR